jgi:uncharacterized phage protein (TIGR02220 family)
MTNYAYKAGRGQGLANLVLPESELTRRQPYNRSGIREPAFYAVHSGKEAMSVKIMADVWASSPAKSTELLTLLALADYADDDGKCWPSIDSLAKKLRFSRSAAQRSVHKLIEQSLVSVIGNPDGGAPGQSRIYRVETGSAHATRSAHATGSVCAPKGVAFTTETGSAHATQPISEPSVNRQPMSTSEKAPEIDFTLSAETATPKKQEQGINGHKKEAIAILDFLNAKTGRHYKPVDVNLKLISARLKEGASFQDCKCIIAKKTREWITDPVMTNYLRPATLFNATKFAQYHGELLED